MSVDSGVATVTPDTFDYSESQPSGIVIYTFNLASAKWLASRTTGGLFNAVRKLRAKLTISIGLM
jgi:hypothetical protein